MYFFSSVFWFWLCYNKKLQSEFCLTELPALLLGIYCFASGFRPVVCLLNRISC